MKNPYLLPNPSVISFSGGRTSGYMLRMILDAFGGVLPEWVKVAFQNTGKEREETLEYIDRVSKEWGVEIVWLEYRWEPGNPYFVVVDFDSASRNGEPFDAVIKARSDAYLPNPAARFCTVEMKMLTLNRWVRLHLGWEKYTNAVGLRADESRRVSKARANAFVDLCTQAELFEVNGTKRPRKVKSGRPAGESVAFPLFDAGVTRDDVDAWWRDASFDLGLRRDEGNCDLCFLKGKGKLLTIMRDRPELAQWWIEQERRIGANGAEARFRNDRPSYAELLVLSQETSVLFADEATGACGELDECRCTD